MELRFSAWEARLYLLKLRSWSSGSPLGKRGLFKNIYIFKKQFNSRHFSGSAPLNYFNNFIKNSINRSESADRECIRPHSSALKARGEKTHGRFPLVAPLFPLRLVPQKNSAQYAAHAITAGRKKQRSAATKAAAHAKSPHIIQNPAFIPPIPPQLIAR